MTRSYVKLYGPPLLKGLKALEKVAIEMSETVEMIIRFYDVALPTLSYDIYLEDPDLKVEELSNILLPEVPLEVEEKVRLISRASDALGNYDFFFEWGREPTKEQVLELIEKIDKALAKCGCKYTIITK